MKFEQYKVARRRLLEKSAKGEEDSSQPSPLVLAWLGDGIFSLYVRKRLVTAEKSKLHALNDIGASMVSAVMQSKALTELLPELSGAELDAVRRGRNTRSSVPKSASMQEYRQSTGFECLLGSLYWQGEEERLHELMGQSFDSINRFIMSSGNGEQL